MDIDNTALLEIEAQGTQIGVLFQELLLAQEKNESDMVSEAREQIEHMMKQLSALGVHVMLIAVMTRTLPERPGKPIRNRKLAHQKHPPFSHKFVLQVNSEIVRHEDGIIKAGWVDTFCYEDAEPDEGIMLFPLEDELGSPENSGRGN